MSHQAPSNGPHDTVLVQRSQTEPVLPPLPVQESNREAQGRLVSPSASSVGSSCDSLPIGEQEQSYGSLQAEDVSKGDTIQEEPEEDLQHPLPSEGDVPSASPSAPLQVDRERDGTDESVVRQRIVDGATDGRRQSPSVQQLPSQSTPQPPHHTREPGECMHEWDRWAQPRVPCVEPAVGRPL